MAHLGELNFNVFDCQESIRNACKIIVKDKTGIADPQFMYLPNLLKFITEYGNQILLYVNEKGGISIDFMDMNKERILKMADEITKKSTVDKESNKK